MSQITSFGAGGGGMGAVLFLSGDVGGPVSPDGAGNIDILGGAGITVTGNPGAFSLTIDTDGLASQYDTDSGSAVPAGGILNVIGAHNMNTAGSGNTVTVADNNTHTLGDLSPVGDFTDSLTLQTGDMTVQSGNINLPLTADDYSNGTIFKDGFRWLHSGGSVVPGGPQLNVYLGWRAGPSPPGPFGHSNNIGIGSEVFHDQTNFGGNNIAIGAESLRNIGIAESNIAIGIVCGTSLTDGGDNILIGRAVCDSLTIGIANIAIGFNSLDNVISGQYNIAIGPNAGDSYTAGESANISISNTGVAGENNTIRIGTTGSAITPPSPGTVEQNRCFIAGIRGVTPPAGPLHFVTIDTAGQLGSEAAGSFASTYATDSGSATPSSGTIDILGGTNIATAGAGNNVTINFDGTLPVSSGGTGATTLTDHGVLVGSGTAAITPLAVGSTGELLVGQTGADPVFAASADGNFSFVSSSAGTARFVEVVNTDNTNVSSHAVLELTTGGSSGGSPFIEFEVDSAQTSRMGILNTADDTFRIAHSTGSLGSADWIMTTDGERTMPNQPAFEAFLPTTDNNVVGADTIFTVGSVTALTEVFDQNGDFNTNGTFTAPVSGRYCFFGTVQVQQISSAMTDGLLYFNSSNRRYRAMRLNPFAVDTGGVAYVGSVFINMDALDTCTLQIHILHGAGDSAAVVGPSAAEPQTWFMGYLVA